MLTRLRDRDVAFRRSRPAKLEVNLKLVEVYLCLSMIKIKNLI